MQKSKKVLNILGMQCSPEHEEKFNTWYNEKHIPDLLKCDAIQRVTRYKVMGSEDPDYPKFIAVYEFADQQAFEAFNNSPELASARSDTAKIFKETNGQLIWRIQYEAIGEWEGG